MDGPAAIEPPADPLAPIAEGFASQPGRAWADTVRVRLLHAQMRARVLKAARRRADADVEERQPGRKMQYKVAEDGVSLFRPLFHPSVCS